MTKRFGFTLAEVLITLGIIGVVAAMTIPTLVKNYQKTVWVNQLKKSVSTLEQGFQKMLADEGVDHLYNSSFGKMLLDDGDDYVCNPAEMKNTNNYLSKYFKVLKFYDSTSYATTGEKDCTLGYEYKTLDSNNTDYINSDLRKIYLLDGTVLGMWATKSTCLNNDNEKECIKIGLDINGDKKGPNQWGRDTFGFFLTSTGHLIPFEEGYANCLTNGFACSKRIIENGWKMDY